MSSSQSSAPQSFSYARRFAISPRRPQNMLVRRSSFHPVRILTAQQTVRRRHLLRGKSDMSTEKEGNTGRHSLRLADKGAKAEAEVQPEKAKLPRQFVTFTFYRARPEWRALGAEEKE